MDESIMAARGILSNPALFSGHKTTPVECVKRWLNICQQADTDITYQCMHHHFSFMTESLLTKRLRLQLNNLSKEKQNVFGFIRTHLPLDSVNDAVMQDYPEKICCSYNDQIYRQRAAGNGAKDNGTIVNGCTYDPEASDGNFFRSKRAELDEPQASDDVAENVDGVAFMDGGNLLFDE
uniref:Uncharacterized protein n=1 Tax=Anopheles maculatus TaxID=74869 RepID=A0A182T6P4_9DIPT